MSATADQLQGQNPLITVGCFMSEGDRIDLVSEDFIFMEGRVTSPERLKGMKAYCAARREDRREHNCPVNFKGTATFCTADNNSSHLLVFTYHDELEIRREFSKFAPYRETPGSKRELQLAIDPPPQVTPELFVTSVAFVMVDEG